MLRKPASTLRVDLLFRLCVHPHDFRFRADYLQLFGHDAAGHVRHVLFPHGVHPHERVVHAGAQHAPVGAMDSRLQPVDLFHSGDAHALPERLQPVGFVAPAGQDAVFHGRVRRGCRVELPQDGTVMPDARQRVGGAANAFAWHRIYRRESFRL